MMKSLCLHRTSQSKVKDFFKILLKVNLFLNIICKTREFGAYFLFIKFSCLSYCIPLIISAFRSGRTYVELAP